MGKTYRNTKTISEKKVYVNKKIRVNEHKAERKAVKLQLATALIDSQP